MAEFRRELSRFPRGQGCDECRARYFYLESGFRYCQNGHRIEGFIEFAREDDEFEGDLGHISRRAKEVRPKQARHLAGKAARELYLDCLHVILRKQVAWLIRVKGFPPDFEESVRDLWYLRIMGFASLSTVGGGEATDGEGSGSGSGSGSGGESAMFSSQDEGSQSGKSTASKKRSSKSWTSKDDEPWNMPGLWDTLGICYLACLLRRLPYRVGEFFTWAKRNQILFLSAIGEIPKAMQDRLPGTYHRTLAARNVTWNGGELHKVVVDLARGYYRSEAALVFPPLSGPANLCQLTIEMCLPAGIYAASKALVEMAPQHGLGYPVAQRTMTWIDHPDIYLLANLVFATKMLHPCDEVQRYRRPGDQDSSLRVNWQAWREAVSTAPSEKFERYRFDKITSDETWGMNDENLDEYMDWYQQVRLQHDDEQRHIADFFPLKALEGLKLHDVNTRNTQEEELLARLRQVQNSLMPVEVREDQDDKDAPPVTRFGEHHQLYKTEDDLPEAARALYERAAEVGGVSLSIMVTAVYTIERRWVRHLKAQKKARESTVEEDRESSYSPE